jgi:hypothetical protein
VTWLWRAREVRTGAVASPPLPEAAG